MKKFIVAIILSLSAAVAFAMPPSPKQVEQALAMKDYQSAQSMIQEVLRDKPDSARAHLLNAYVLLKQGNKVAANEELNNVNRLDHKGDVKSSALYGRTVAEIDAPTARPQPRQAFAKPAPVVASTPTKQSDSYLGTALLIGAVIIIAIILCYFIFREKEPKVVHASGGGYPSTTGYVNNGRTYETTPHPVYPAERAAASGPSTVVVNSGGNGTGMMNGMMTGMLMSEMMHHNHGHSHHHDSGYSERYVDTGSTYRQPDPEPAPTTSYESRSSSFSSSSSREDDSWGGSSSSSSFFSSSDSSDWGGSSDSGGGGSWD